MIFTIKDTKLERKKVFLIFNPYYVSFLSNPNLKKENYSNFNIKVINYTILSLKKFKVNYVTLILHDIIVF